MIDESSLREDHCHEYLLGLKLTPDHEWNSYIRSIPKDTENIVCLLYQSSIGLPPVLQEPELTKNGVLLLGLPSSHLPT